jgi:pimeloyl-ACP methyl ester carboxylesterase
MAPPASEVEVGGLRIAYERVGRGPPLVLLHGYVGDGRSTWGPQLDGLSDAFTVVAWDAPGAGRSADPPAAFGLADFADCLAGFVAALGLERPHVAGLSFGGGLALELYRRHPEVPRSLVLASAYAGWAGSLPPEVAGQRLRQAVEMAGLPPERFAGEVLPTLFSASAPPGLVARFADAVLAFHPDGLRVMARAFADADLRPVLARIAVPTLLLYGEHDVRAPAEVAHALHAAIPDSTLVVLPGAGHVVSLEEPERVNAELRAFLSR